jgi:hypothetical protein
MPPPRAQEIHGSKLGYLKWISWAVVIPSTLELADYQGYILTAKPKAIA